MQTILIDGRTIGSGNPTFVIAEIGINHAGDEGLAERMIKEAASCGADAVKFQTYITEKRVPTDSPIFDVLKRAELSEESHVRLQAAATHAGVAFFSTPFDAESVDLLTRLNVPAFKIASFDIVNLQLLRAVARTGRPVIASRGMASREELDRAVAIFEGAGASYALLHCISAYPTPADQTNLGVIRAMAQTYRCPIGYSDHTLGPDVPVYAVAAGATLIEKHFTLDRNIPGPDHALSADPAQFRDMVRRIREVERMVGRSQFMAYEVEQGTLVYRRPSA